MLRKLRQLEADLQSALDERDRLKVAVAFWRGRADNLESQRNAAYSEIDKLKEQLRQARDRIERAQDALGPWPVATDANDAAALDCCNGPGKNPDAQACEGGPVETLSVNLRIDVDDAPLKKRGKQLTEAGKALEG